MSWIDERKAESDDLESRSRLIRDKAGDVFEALWKKIKESVEEARQKLSKELLTNGSPWDRVVSMPMVPKHDQRIAAPKELHIALKNQDAVHVAGPGINMTFQLDVCDDNVVCLKFEGRDISIGDAAVKILDRFLFPDLPVKF